MTKIFASTDEHKEAIISDAIDKLNEVMVMDNQAEEVRLAVTEVLTMIRHYPDLEHIKAYPLGRSRADYKVVEIEKNLCLILSGEAPNGTLDVVFVQLSQALSNLQSLPI